MHDPVQPCPHQEHEVRVLQRVGPRRRDRQRVIIGNHALAHRRGQERELRLVDELANVVLGARVGHALADDHERPLRRLQRVDGRVHRARLRVRAGRVGAAVLELDLRLLDARGDHVVGEVQVHRPRPPVHARAHALLDVVGHALDGLRPARELHERPRGLHLRRFLERALPVLVRVRRAADEDHRPRVRPGIRQPRDAVDHPRPADRQARARPPGQVADRARGVARRLLVVEAEVADPLPLGRRRDARDRESHHAEHVVDALLLETARDDGRAVDFCHLVTPWRS